MTLPAPELGVDVGATLAKIAHRSPAGGDPAEFEFLASSDLRAVADRVAEFSPSQLGVTGGGATRLSALLDCRARRVDEFEAWGAGAVRLLSAEDAGDTGSERVADERFLLVSLGTGTSVLLVDADRTTRVGGTALGGGTVQGLGGALAGATFEELCTLARAGSAAAVDLRVADIYGADEIPLAGDLTAANFGKLAREAARESGVSAPTAERRADLAAGVMGLVGENVALICAGLADVTDTMRIVYAGFTVRDNPRLVEVLSEVTALSGRRACFLPNGEFAGALGALELAHAQA